MNQSFKHINHQLLRYSNCWEDAEILAMGLDVKPEDNILSIGSGGDNSLFLLSKNPASITAIDVNSTQLFLIELKQCAIRHLAHFEFLEFMGFKASTNKIRQKYYDQLANDLSVEARHYWDDNQYLIHNGLIYQGKFEKYFLIFSRFVLPLIHSKKKVVSLLKPKSAEEQAFFYNKEWNTWRWRLLFKIFFGKRVMAKLGRDKALFNEVRGSVKDMILEKAELELSSVSCQKNYFLRFILMGHFGDLLPLYARAEHYHNIKTNIDKLTLKNGLIEAGMSKNETYDKFNLSNIFEYLTEKEFLAIASELEQIASSNARFVYWNLMVPRDLTAVSNIKTLDIPKTRKDNGFFYKQYFYNTL